jgi:7-cyano-7-deazaguanine synthase
MKAIVILSGGLDSTVLLAHAISNGRTAIALTFDYGQRHRDEIHAAKAVTAHYGVQHIIVTIDTTSLKQSALISGTSTALPKDRNIADINNGAIPSTYVPARNTLFLAHAAAHAEISYAQEIYLGANASDQIPYPDTRPAYQEAFQNLLRFATKQAVEGSPPRVLFPLGHLYKQDIIRLGAQLRAPLELTLSCYDPQGGTTHCGRCDACYLRKRGFEEANVTDPTAYLASGETKDLTTGRVTPSKKKRTAR